MSYPSLYVTFPTLDDVIAAVNPDCLGYWQDPSGLIGVRDELLIFWFCWHPAGYMLIGSTRRPDEDDVFVPLDKSR